MELDNSSSAMAQKHFYKRTNRHQEQWNDSYQTFDNDAFEEDETDIPTSQLMYRQNDRCYTVDGYHDQSLADDFMTNRVQQLSNPQNEMSLPKTKPRAMPRRQLPNIPTTTPNNTNAPSNNIIDSELNGSNYNYQKRNIMEYKNTNSQLNTTEFESQIDNSHNSAYQNPHKDEKSNFAARTTLPSQNINCYGSLETKMISVVQDCVRQNRHRFSVDTGMLKKESSFENDSVDSLGGGNKVRRTTSLNWDKLRKRPLRLLRDLSFSDANDSTMKDYGSLKNINLPRRSEKGPIGQGTTRVLESLMVELTKRGKISQVAILDMDGSSVLASVPAGFLSYSDVMGMTRAVICKPHLFRLQIANVDYHCFKHRQDAVQGRAPEVVMVMQTTESCVVAGFAREDAPGSCNSEVNEFAKVLTDAGW